MEASFIDICENVAHRLERERLVINRLKLKPKGEETEIWISLAGVRREAAARSMQCPRSERQNPYPCFQRVFADISDYRCDFQERVQHRRWARIVRLRVPTAELRRFGSSTSSQTATNHNAARWE